MNSRIPVDNGEIIPITEVHAPGSFHDIQRRIGTMLIDEAISLDDALRMLINVMTGCIAANADSAPEAQARMVWVSRQLDRLAPSAAQAHFEVHHGGARG